MVSEICRSNCFVQFPRVILLFCAIIMHLCKNNVHILAMDAYSMLPFRSFVGYVHCFPVFSTYMLPVL